MDRSLTRSFYATVLQDAAEKAWTKFELLPRDLQKQQFMRLFQEREGYAKDATVFANLSKELQKRAKILMAEKNGMPKEMIERYLG